MYRVALHPLFIDSLPEIYIVEDDCLALLVDLVDNSILSYPILPEPFELSYQFQPEIWVLGQLFDPCLYPVSSISGKATKLFQKGP